MRAVYLSGLLVVVLAAITFWMVSDLQPGVIVLQFAWTPRGFGEIVHVWPPEDLERYRLHLPLDSLLLLAYGSFGWLLATRTALFASLPRLACAAAPFVLPLAAAFDADAVLFLSDVPGVLDAGRARLAELTPDLVRPRR